MAWDDLQYWADHLTVSTEKYWVKRVKSLHICGDASCVGYGAYMPDDAFTGDCLPSIQGFRERGLPLMFFLRSNVLYLFAAHHGVHVDFIWKPRESLECSACSAVSGVQY